ncbi:glyoxalase/bleomycin resistance protein/dioxygenase [Scytonema sp. HK-05]|uniref:VOC family protein n=1 Tax=Scytonema sp. HK-05 TaxID=1137095 RepID=UPI00093691DE|nr:VOC family protein [Scytonema sp. HK-05]OKH52776.1 bleomycin resistance protein [Scytonema sp. HK-05]BAY43542.1 glyoxalase/bleomycin resistance protein/dioxygenase [Scytonema sp. HK-05]
MWIDGVNHIQITSPPEKEDATVFFYSKVLGLEEIPKPEPIKAFGGAWYSLGDIQIHVTVEKNPDNETSRRHICYQVHDLNAFGQHIEAHGVEIFPDQNPIPGCKRFFLRDPAGNRIEIAEFTQDFVVKA